MVNPKDNTISIFSGLQYLGNLPTGTLPWDVRVHPKTGYAFVANRTSNDITVLKNGRSVTTIPSQGIQPWSIGIDATHNDVYIVNRGVDRELYHCHDASVTILR